MRESFLTVALLSALAATPASAQFASCIASLRSQAVAAGVTAETYDSLTRGLERNDAASFLDNQPEFTTPVWDYLAALVDEERVTDGRARLAQYARVLANAERDFGVDRYTVIAVWGVESDYGRSIGKRYIVQSLATLSCEGRRQDYFRTEFFAALRILQNRDMTPDEMMGSWAGAFGHTQFMPSTFHRFAVDHDGDGKRDIAGSVPDALGSTANYLRKSGWDRGLDWGYEVKLPDNYSGPDGRRVKHPMSFWAKKGLRRVDGKPLGNGVAGLILPAGKDGPAFLVTRNFDAIFSYNASLSYGLAIAHLSDRLRGGKAFVTPWPTDDPGLSRVERRELQALLLRKGYDIGATDGVIGEKTRQAIADVQSRAGLTRDGRAGKKILNHLRGS
jgi:lytic murein transglycosylase